MVVSIISFGGYLPYLVSSVFRNVNRTSYESFVYNYASLELFIKWMMFLNNAINPMIYGFMDAKFRREIVKTYICIKSKLSC